MINLALPAFGVALFAACLTPLIHKRTTVTILNACAAALCLVAFCLWPDSYGLAFDHAVHGIGVAFLISRTTITAGAMLHIVAVAYGIGRWDRKRQRLLVWPVTLSTGLYVLFWGLAHRSHVADLETLFYHGYHGRPDTVLAMSVARGVTIMWYSAIAVYLYLYVALESYRARQWKELLTPVTTMSLIFVGSFVIGVIDMVEAFADHAGRTGHIIALLPELSFLGLIACIGAFVVVYLINLTARPVWRVGRDVRYAPERLTEIRRATAELERARAELAEERVDWERVRADVRDLSTRVDSKLIPIIPYADPAVERAMKDETAKEGLDDEDRELGLTAARTLTLHPDHIYRLRKPGEQRLDPDALGADGELAAGTRHFAKLSERDLYHYAEVNLVLALALGAERFGVPLRRQPEERHRRVACVLARVLERYDQPYSYVTAYQKEMAQRALEKGQMLRDMGIDTPAVEAVVGEDAPAPDLQVAAPRRGIGIHR